MTSTSRHEGFVLVVTLWVIAALALAAAAFGAWVAEATERARQLKARSDAELRFADTRATIIMFFTTHPLSARGLEVQDSLRSLTQFLQRSRENPLDTRTEGRDFVALDDRPHRAVNGTIVQLQDTRGLVNINLASREDLLRLLEVYGVPMERRDPLVAKLQDYVDADDLLRLNGAERDEYRRAGRPPPNNAPLRTIWEARRVLGWGEEPSLWFGDDLTRIATAGLVVGYNLNTAPAKVLEVAAGMTAEVALEAVKRRQKLPLTSLDQLVGLPAPRALGDPLRIIMFPSDALRVTLRDPPSGRLREFVLRTTPVSPAAPWVIDYVFDPPTLIAEGHENLAAIPELPDPAAVLAPR